MTGADVVVVGATPGGIMAAIGAARGGCRVLLLDRNAHIGGLPANGLGATDIQTRGATGGLFRGRRGDPGLQLPPVPHRCAGKPRRGRTAAPVRPRRVCLARGRCAPRRRDRLHNGLLARPGRGQSLPAAERQDGREQPPQRLPLHRPARGELAVAHRRLGLARPVRRTPARLHARAAVVLPERSGFAGRVPPRRAALGPGRGRVRRQRPFPAPGLCARRPPHRGRIPLHGTRRDSRHARRAAAAARGQHHRQPLRHRFARRAQTRAGPHRPGRVPEPRHRALHRPVRRHRPAAGGRLLTPVPVSATHLGFGTLRMEPCWMALGQAAGVAAALCIAADTAPRRLDVARLQAELLRQKAVLFYFRDVPPAHPRGAALQRAGLRGLLPEWEARPDQPVLAEDAHTWAHACGRTVPAFTPGATTRAEFLAQLLERT